MTSPKARFFKSDQSKFHADLVTSPRFQEWMDAALLQMSWEQSGASATSEVAAMKAMELEGARKLIRIFMGLSSTEPARTTHDDNLTPT